MPFFTHHEDGLARLLALQFNFPLPSPHALVWLPVLLCISVFLNKIFIPLGSVQILEVLRENRSKKMEENKNMDLSLINFCYIALQIYFSSFPSNIGMKNLKIHQI